MKFEHKFQSQNFPSVVARDLFDPSRQVILSTMADVELPQLDAPGINAKDLIEWLQARPEEELVT